MVIRKGVVKEYTVDYFNKKYIYEGDGKIENNYFCVDMTSKGFVVNDSTHHRYNVTKIDEKDLCYGFWLSTDFNGMVSCGSVILTKDKISAAMLDSLVKEYFETFNDIPFLTVK